MVEHLHATAQPIGLLSDVHGDIVALDAVLDALRRYDVGRILVAGDLLFGGDAPLEVWRRLQSLGALCVRGVSDTALATIAADRLEPDGAHERARAERFAATQRALGDLVLEQLRRLPLQLRMPMIDGRELLLVHGAPVDPTLELSIEMSDDELLARVGDDPADVVVCGATHVPFHRQLDGLDVLNVGSVGEAPGPTDARVAHFTVLRPRMDGPEIIQEWVELGR
ncbi:MAG: metallophosphoesterase family protein [Myxococcales bacterium]|nr:metallophosphoesterase family protein [Myxococcales bacterium]